MTQVFTSNFFNLNSKAVPAQSRKFIKDGQNDLGAGVRCVCGTAVRVRPSPLKMPLRYPERHCISGRSGRRFTG